MTAPIMLMAHQREGLEYLLANGCGLLAFEQGLGKTLVAIEAYRRAVESDPFFAEAHLSLARLYEKTGKKTAARRHLKSYRELTAKGGKAVRR